MVIKTLNELKLYWRSWWFFAKYLQWCWFKNKARSDVHHAVCVRAHYVKDVFLFRSGDINAEPSAKVTAFRNKNLAYEF